MKANIERELHEEWKNEVREKFTNKKDESKPLNKMSPKAALLLCSLLAPIVRGE